MMHARLTQPPARTQRWGRIAGLLARLETGPGGAPAIDLESPSRAHDTDPDVHDKGRRGSRRGPPTHRSP